jgi:AraC-like DNA-binding protein
MLSVDTASLPPRQRVAYWNDVVGDIQTRMRVEPADADAYSGVLHWDALGEAGLSTATSSRSILHRTRAHIAQADRRFFVVNLALRGEYTVAQGGREGVVREGDFAINDSVEPFTITHHAECAAGVLMVPEKLMKRHLPLVEALGGRAICGQSGRGALASDTLRSLCRQLERGYSEALDGGVAEHVVALIASACAAQYERLRPATHVTDFRRADIRRYIESQLTQPDLGPELIARHFRISARYLRLLFETEGEGVAAYVLRRRLEECARRLADSRWGGRTVSEIALAWGFNSLGSFDRAFKRQYRLPPHEYRRSHGQSAV